MGFRVYQEYLSTESQVGSKDVHSSQSARSFSIVSSERKMKYGALMMASCISAVCRFGHWVVFHLLHRVKMSSVFMPAFWQACKINQG